MPAKKKFIVSGKSTDMPASFLDNLSDFSSDEESLESPESPIQQQSAEENGKSQITTSTGSILETNTPEPPVILPNTLPIAATDQESESTSSELSIPTPDIVQLLDDIAAKIQDINLRVEQYNSLMEMAYEYLKLRYHSTLTDENVDCLKNFLINACSTNKPYSKLLQLKKRKLQETGEKIGSKKRKLEKN